MSESEKRVRVTVDQKLLNLVAMHVTNALHSVKEGKEVDTYTELLKAAKTLEQLWETHTKGETGV